MKLRGTWRKPTTLRLKKRCELLNRCLGNLGVTTWSVTSCCLARDQSGQATLALRLQGAASQLLFQVNITLITGHQLAQHFPNAAMAAGELNHAISERCAPEVSIKSAPHLRSSL